VLENSLWQQYPTDRSIRVTLAAIYGCDVEQIGDDEAELYATLKRHLTKKELRLFIMSEAGEEPAAIADELKIDGVLFEKSRYKTYSKIKGNKIQDHVRTLHIKSKKSDEVRREQP